MRGGTSNALVFRVDDLPADRAEWDAIFLAALGEGLGCLDQRGDRHRVDNPNDVSLGDFRDLVQVTDADGRLPKGEVCTNREEWVVRHTSSIILDGELSLSARSFRRSLISFCVTRTALASE